MFKKKSIPSCRTCKHGDRTNRGYSVCINYKKCEKYNKNGELLKRRLHEPIPEQKTYKPPKQKEKRDARAEEAKKIYANMISSIERYTELTGKSPKDTLMKLIGEMVP